MNFRLISKTVGLLLLLLAVAMALCGAAGVLAKWRDPAFSGLFLCAAITFAAGIGFIVLGRHGKGELLRRESIAIVVLGWMACSLFGSLPYILSDTGLTIPQALFESTSGITTTGATVAENLETWSQTLLLWRSTSQWLGGIGILVLFVALLSFFKMGGKALFQHESSVQKEHITFTSIKRTALMLLKIYLGLTFLCFTAYWALGMSIFEAVNHSFTTLATAGFGTRDDSFASFSPGIQWVCILFMISASISFLLYARWILAPKGNLFRIDEPGGWFLFSLLAGAVALGLSRYFAAPVALSELEPFLRENLFQVTSILSTTGYASADFAEWTTFSQMLLLILMVIGGCAGSTSGGLKINRFVALLRILREELVRYYRPRIVLNIPETKTEEGKARRRQILTIFILAALLTGTGTLFLAAFEPSLSPLDALSGTMACVLNIGPALGQFGPDSNYASLGSGSLLFLSMLMIIGRLEILAAMAIFSRHFWQKY
ncbi:MAG: TrkH family potassium uptake protein [Verrucomicrobiota bacterium]